jgi:predicted AAA+ superfamily ATPase
MKNLPNRYIKASIINDLLSKMVFIGGPRQVGKTTLSLSFLDPPAKTNPYYLNWDVQRSREKILKGELPVQTKVLILDEIHKFADWRRLVKGLYDEYIPELQVIVTGSARLDYYRKGGDSLLGRYHYYRLHPYSLKEFGHGYTKKASSLLLNFGGFPEPLLKASETFSRRWRRERVSRIINEDLRDLEHVQEVSRIERLVQLLPERVSTPLSVNALAKGLTAAHETVERWLTILENLYLTFRIFPYDSSLIRAVKKERKIYFWDWSQAPEGGQRFENLVASTLLKYCHFLEDTEGFKMELRYLRDEDGREVDFVVLRDDAPLFAVECKVGSKDVAPACTYFRERTKIPEFYQTHLEDADFGHAKKGVRIIPFWTLCEEKGLA